MRLTRMSSCFMAACVAATPGLAETIKVDDPTATFGPGNTWIGWSVKISSTLVEPGDDLKIQYYDEHGRTVGGPLIKDIKADRKLTIPPPPIPPGASALGSQVKISTTTFPAPVEYSQSLVTYNSSSIWGVTASIKVDPIGLPGTSGTQHWFIQDTGVGLTTSDSIFGTRSLTVLDSGFDLSYLLVGGTSYEVIVSGNDSFMRLSDQTYLGFIDGSSFGTIDISGGTSGSFDFSAVGLSGSWSYNPLTSYTGATATSLTPFSAPAISVIPEPSTYAMALAGFVCGGWQMLRRRRRA